jgi:UDP-GlcNAc3NAcA epimerase
MYDNSLFFAELAERKKADLLRDMSLERDRFILITIHREINTDDRDRLEAIMRCLRGLSEDFSIPFIMPCHPRTLNSLKTNLGDLFDELRNCRFLRIMPPVSYLEMTLLEKTCKMILTDSGGVQKESHFFKKPCIVLRKETEWVELVANGTVRLTDANPEMVRNEFSGFMNQTGELQYPGFYGDGKTAEFILKEILLFIGK